MNDRDDELGRVLAVDYGRRRVGVAISDPTGTIATGLDTLVVRDTRHAVTQIAKNRSRWEYDRIVVGLPLLTSGERGPMAEEVLGFVEELRNAVRVPVETLDERFTSNQAMRMLHETGRRTKGNKERIDQIAAELLLRQYLDMHSKPVELNLDDDEEEDD